MGAPVVLSWMRLFFEALHRHVRFCTSYELMYHEFAKAFCILIYKPKMSYPHL